MREIKAGGYEVTRDEHGGYASLYPPYGYFSTAGYTSQGPYLKLRFAFQNSVRDALNWFKRKQVTGETCDTQSSLVSQAGQP